MKRPALFSGVLFLFSFSIVALSPPGALAQENKSLRIVFVSLSRNNQLHFASLSPTNYSKTKAWQSNRSSCVAAQRRLPR